MSIYWANPNISSSNAQNTTHLISALKVQTSGFINVSLTLDALGPGLGGGDGLLVKERVKEELNNGMILFRGVMKR